MKKILFMCALFLISVSVNAQSIKEVIKEDGYYTNLNGVKITEENYNKVKDYYSEDKINNISKALYQAIEKSNGLKGYDEKVIDTGYIIQNGNIKQVTMVRDEYDLNSLFSTALGRDYVITASKRIQLSVFDGSNNENIFSIENSWITGKLPKYRSYDVFALMWEGGNVIKKSLVAEQDYGINGREEIIYYDEHSGNVKNFSNGVGLSQNLVDDATSYYQFMNQHVTCTGGKTTVYGTYQHAQADVTLAQSMSYSLTTKGMGGVIGFSSSVEQYYDNTPGVKVTFTC